ncbi:unnamed protein product [Schistosoma spindalis]|nr:unnamed protein product [Schistosoma spindale]
MSGPRPHISITFRKSKKPQLNDSVRIMRNRGLLNTSRRLLQKSVNQSFTSATSLRANNASLAKKLAELQVELNNQKMATQQANIELLNCRMEVARLQAYKEAKEKIKACILNIHELLCSQIEMGMSMMNYVKDSISVLDKNDSLELLSNPTSSLLGETAVDLNAFDSVCRKEFTKPAQQITEENVCQLSIVYPEVQSPSSSTSLITGPVKMAFSPKDQSIANNISTNRINNNRLNIQPMPLIETLNTDVKSSQSIRQEPLVVVVPSCEVLPEILTSPITCISENNITSKRCLPIVDTNVNNVDLDNDNDNTHKNISPIKFSVQSLPQSCISVNKPSVVDSKNIDQLVVPDLVNSCCSKNKEYVVNPVDHHAIQSARPHLVRQARLNSKPIIDTSSFMDSFIVKTTTTKEKKKKSGKHRLIRVKDSDDEEGEDDVNKLENNIGVVGGDEDGGGRVIETCFRRPGELVFRVDSKNVNPSSTAGVSDHYTNKQTTRSKSKLPTTTINQQSRSKSKPHTTTTTSATANINSNNDNTNKEVNSNEFKKMPKVVGTEVKTVNIFDLSMNRTADLSVLPPTLNDLRIKHKEERQHQVNSNTKAQKDTTVKMALTTRKRSVLGELQQQENDKLNSVVKNNYIVDEHRRLSVVLTSICNENQPPFDAQISNSKNNKRQFRRLYLFDQENEDNDDNGNDVDNDHRLKNMKADVGNTVGKQSKYNNPTSSIGKLDNNRNSNLPMTINPKVTTSRSRKRN